MINLNLYVLRGRWNFLLNSILIVETFRNTIRLVEQGKKMKIFLKSSLCLVALLSVAFCQTQDIPKNKVVRRITIKHTDPALIALILAGNKNYCLPSEISTVQKTQGSGSGNSGGKGS